MATNPYTLRAKDVMSRDVVAVSPDDSLHEALELMVENRVAALPVVNGRDRCVGILSSSDLIDVMRELDDDLTSLETPDSASHQWLLDRLRRGIGDDKVCEHMTDRVASVGADSPLADAVREMLRNRVHRLPVTDSHDRLMGIISTMDILEVFADGG